MIGGTQMLKIIWNREDFEKISDKILSEFNIQVTDDPNEVPEHKVGLLLDSDNVATIEKLIKKLMMEKQTMIFPTQSGYLQINVQEINYLEAFGDDIFMHVEHDQSQQIKQPLYQLEGMLKPYHFIRIGKSFIVNASKIRYIRTAFNAKLDLELLDGTHLEVSRSFVKDFKNAIGIQKKED
jgi:DNA-binding LytR/AlgR family response regulator